MLSEDKLLSEFRIMCQSGLQQSKDITNSMAYGTWSSIPHSQGLSNKPYPEPNQPNSSY